LRRGDLGCFGFAVVIFIRHILPVAFYSIGVSRLS
jgi:hypothetical protein